MSSLGTPRRTIWIYTSNNYLIAKCAPFSYHVPSYGPRGYAQTLMQGVAIEEPVWSQVTKKDGLTWAVHDNHIYDITDLQRVYFILPR